MNALIVIPARFSSTRFPGKPLVKIAGQSMLSRVVAIAQTAIEKRDNVSVVVATDHEEIADHCIKIGAPYVMTPTTCQTGTDRVLAAISQIKNSTDFVINLQGDSPLTPANFITALIDEFINDPTLQVITPVTQLSWSALDKLRENKLSTPFSGTTAILDQHNNARWFSKNIIPAIRNEEKLREKSANSPVYRHIGLYGYATDFLKKFVTWPMSQYEILEGLEQLRILENGHSIRCIQVDYQGLPAMSGVDSPEDVLRVEKLLREQDNNQ